MIESILLAKEQRLKIIKSQVEPGYAVIAIKSNIPGINKHCKEAYFLCRLFFNEINVKLKIDDHQLLDFADGPWILIKLKHDNPKELKLDLITLEDKHPLGRFIDLDLYVSDYSLSRSDYSKPLRKCYLCENEAFKCQRLNLHQTHELTHFIETKTKEYLKNEIHEMIESSIIRELNLEHKFGLVTQTSSGSHPDMDYALMLKAKDAIVPHLIDLFFLGFDSSNHNDLMIEARKIGIKAEHDMMIATKQVNCYKGLIFVLGLFVLSTGVALSQKMFKPNIREYITYFSKDLIKEFDRELDTFGKKAYLDYQIDGVRGEAYRGFPSIYNLIDQFKFSHDLDDQTLRNILKLIIVSTQDTVLLKRSGSLENYELIKEKIALLDTNDIEQVKQFTAYAIKNHLSFGGSADLLVSYIYMKLIHQKFLI